MWVEWCGKIPAFDSDIISHERKQAKAIVSSRPLVSFRPDTGHRSVHPSAASVLTIQSQFADRWIVLKVSVIELHLQTLEQPSFSIFLSLSLPSLYCSLGGRTIACLVLMGSLQSRQDPEMSLNVILHHQRVCYYFFLKNFKPYLLTVSSDYTEDHHSLIHYGLRASFLKPSDIVYEWLYSSIMSEWRLY